MSLFQMKKWMISHDVSLVNDTLALGHPEDVKEIEEDLAKAFICKCKGELKE